MINLPTGVRFGVMPRLNPTVAGADTHLNIGQRGQGGICARIIDGASNATLTPPTDLKKLLPSANEVPGRLVIQPRTIPPTVSQAPPDGDGGGRSPGCNKVHSAGLWGQSGKRIRSIPVDFCRFNRSPTNRTNRCLLDI